MSDYNKPIIVISKCLGFDNCKYDGSIENNEFIEKLKKYVKVIPICPEIECGLQIHHSKLRIVENNNKEELLIPNEDLNLTQEMHDFSNKFLNKLTNVDGFILKSKSPICALKDAKVYDTLEKAPRYTSNINVLMKSLEQFGDKISTEELQFLWTTIDKYKNGYIPFTVPLYLVKSYVVRFELYNLLDQSFFMPYPEDLIILNH